MSPRILDVGQCGFDGPRIRKVLRDELEADIDCADTLQEAVELAASTAYDLVLFNRVLDSDHAPGLSVIAALRQANPALRVMLVSDRPDAQQEAAKLGALPGFGKAALFDEATVALLRRSLHGA